MLLLERRVDAPLWSLIAGRVEDDESLADAVRREVFEETGVQVGEVGFHSSQPWPFPHSLMLGCVGKAETTDLVVDTNELAEARWFSRDDARLMLARKHPDGLTVPGKQAIANALITSFVDGS
jgi:NAD+ diphosphatase